MFLWYPDILNLSSPLWTHDWAEQCLWQILWQKYRLDMFSSCFSTSAMDCGMKMRKETAPVIKRILMMSSLWQEAGETLLPLWNLSILLHRWSPSMSTSPSSRLPSGGRVLAAYPSFLTGQASPHTGLREVNAMAFLGFERQMNTSHRIILLKPWTGCWGGLRGYWMLLLLSDEIWMIWTNVSSCLNTLQNFLKFKWRAIFCDSLWFLNDFIQKLGKECSAWPRSRNFGPA